MWTIWVLIVGVSGCLISCYVDEWTGGDYKFQLGVLTGMIIACIVGFN